MDIRCGYFYSFGSRTARDAWVDNGAAYSGNPGYREAIRSDDAELRRLRAADERQEGVENDLWVRDWEEAALEEMRRDRRIDRGQR